MQRSAFGEGGVGDFWLKCRSYCRSWRLPQSACCFHVVLSDCVMSCVDCPGVFVHCELGCDVFGSLVISVKMVDIGRVAVEL